MTPQPLAWWQTGVVYQIYPRSFADTDGDGVGDLDGITRHLDYLTDTLGVDAIWVSPFYPSPMRDFGYDVADYTDVDPLFGSLAAFDHLLARAHARGLKVIIDFVPNHSSDRHPWFVESRSSRQAPRRDWYVWRDAAPDGGPPNNWLSVFGGPAWTWDAATGQYYLHSFLSSQPDLDWRNPAVERAMHDVMRFWLGRGVDGLRLDAIYFIAKDPALRDNPPSSQRGAFHKSFGAYDAQQHLYDKNHPDLHALLRRMRAVADEYSTPEQPRVLVGEAHIYDFDKLARFYGAALDELHLPFNFSLLQATGEADWFRRTVAAFEAALPPGAWPNYVLGNHDETRLATRFGPDRARLLAMLLLTLRGTPTLYYGDELGLEEAAIPPEQQQDPWARREPALGRDGCRTPMPWTGESGAGFSDAAPWLPLNPDFPTRNVAAQRADPHSLLNLYRALLRLRRRHPALHRGDYAATDGAPDGCFVFNRSAGGEALRIALNFSGAPQRYGGGDTLLLSTHAGARPGLLRPFEGHVVGRR